MADRIVEGACAEVGVMMACVWWCIPCNGWRAMRVAVLFVVALTGVAHADEPVRSVMSLRAGIHATTFSGDGGDVVARGLIVEVEQAWRFGDTVVAIAFCGSNQRPQYSSFKGTFEPGEQLLMFDAMGRVGVHTGPVTFGVGTGLTLGVTRDDRGVLPRGEVFAGAEMGSVGGHALGLFGSAGVLVVPGDYGGTLSLRVGAGIEL